MFLFNWSRRNMFWSTSCGGEQYSLFLSIYLLRWSHWKVSITTLRLWELIITMGPIRFLWNWVPIYFLWNPIRFLLVVKLRRMFHNFKIIVKSWSSFTLDSWTPMYSISMNSRQSCSSKSSCLSCEANSCLNSPIVSTKSITKSIYGFGAFRSGTFLSIQCFSMLFDMFSLTSHSGQRCV